MLAPVANEKLATTCILAAVKLIMNQTGQKVSDSFRSGTFSESIVTI